MKRFGFLLLTLLIIATLPLGLAGCSAQKQPQSSDEKAQEIYRSLMCPICPGETIEQSQSEVSAQMRALVREKLQQGETKEEILQFFVDRYGEQVLSYPTKQGFNLLVWITPIAAIIVGGGVVWLAIRKWVKHGKAPLTKVVTLTKTTPGDEKYRAQLEQELKKFHEKGFR